MKHISYNCKCKFNSTKCNSDPKWNNKTCQCEFKNYCMCKKDDSWNRSTCICENAKCLKSIVDGSIIMCNEIINVIDNIPINVTNTMPANVSSTVSINSDDKESNM